MNDELTCAEIEELLPAYAVDALVEEERCSFLAHLAECRRHDEDMAAYRAVTSRLPEVVDPVSPPSRVRSSLLDSFDSLVAGPSTTAPQRIDQPRPRTLGILRAPAFAYGLAAAFLVLALGLGVALSSSGGGEDVTQASVNQNGQTLAVKYFSDQKVAVVDMNLAALPSGRTYQAWQIVNGAPVSLGVVPGNTGPFAFNVDLSNASQIAISSEPAGGSAQPTQVVIGVEI